MRSPWSLLQAEQAQLPQLFVGKVLRLSESNSSFQKEEEEEKQQQQQQKKQGWILAIKFDLNESVANLINFRMSWRYFS